MSICSGSVSNPVPTDGNSLPAELEPLEFVSPGLFSIHNPSVRRPAPSGPVCTQQLQGQNELKQTALQLFRQLGRHIRLYSTDFEPWLYSHTDMANACKDFLLAHENNRLHILLRDSRRLTEDSHRLLPLIERISSRAEIRLTHPDYEIHPGCWLTCDETALLLRQRPDPYQGQLFLGQPARARPYNEQFDAMWALARPDINLRRMTL